MLSVKMKAKKLVLLFLFAAADILTAGIVQHTVISITEQTIMGQHFKHVMKSGNVESDEFFMNGHSVTPDVYRVQLEMKEKQERDAERARHEAMRRNRLQFADSMQVEIIGKLLHNVVYDIARMLQRIQNPALEKFFVFHETTIESPDQLVQLKNFSEQLDAVIQKKIAMHDVENLHTLYTKLEFWPQRLEKFFQDTVNNAIKKSDDTAMLKELLKLVSEA